MQLGARLGPYQIVAMLGAGGMGEVYRARDTRLDRQVAVKILPPEYAQNAEFRARFEREARMISSMSDPHICALYDIGEAEVDCDGHAQRVSYIVMEYLEGESLADRIARGALPLEQSLRFGAEIADALSSAHRHGIVHRDLKPGNVMITAAGAKLLDFGLAKTASDCEVPEDPAATDAPTDPITHTGFIVGTLPYMAPEQLEGRAADARTDIFALGVLLYEMATGRRAFVGTSSPSLASAILRDEPKPMSDVDPAVPRAFERLVRRCLVKDPEQRWQSAKDIAAELREIRDDTDGNRAHGISTAGTPAAGTPPRRSWMVVASGLAALVASAFVLAWFVRHRAHDRPAPPRVDVSQLTTQPGVEWFPSLSPDGKWLVYAGSSSGHRHIVLQGVGGQKPLDLTEDSADDNDQPVFSPDGERIAFRSSREGGGLFVMGRTGEAVRRVTRAGFRPTWSPDGTQLAFTTESVDLYPQNAAERSQLWTVTANGGEPRRLYEGDAVLANWSPNNRRIAFTSRISNPFRADIFTIPVSGGRPVPVTDDVWTDWSPVWSPDGNFIYFASDRGGSMNLWRIPLDEASGKVRGAPEPITVPATSLAHPSISADGRHIAYTSAQVTANIQRLQFDPVTWRTRGDPAWVTTGSRRWSSPDPSPDGQWIAFYSLTQPEGHVYVARADGTGLRQVTGDAAIDRVPRWSPDGKWLVFFSNRGGPMELWKIRSDGSDLQPISKGGYSYIAWSPDSARIATVKLPTAPADNYAVIFDANRPWQQQTIDRLPPMDAAFTRFLVNSWSPDGLRLAGSIDPMGHGIATYTIGSRTYERLTDFGEWPVWLPDSRHILFVAKGKAFYIVDSRSKEVRTVFSVVSDVIGPPRLTPNGMAFFSRRITEADVWMLTLN